LKSVARGVALPGIVTALVAGGLGAGDIAKASPVKSWVSEAP